MNEVYSAAITLPEDILEPIKIFKQGLESVVGKYASFYSDPVIILFAAVCDEHKLKLIEQKVESICRNQLPFIITLKDFDVFHAHRTVFIPTDDNSKTFLSAFRKKLSLEIKIAKYDEDVDFNIGKTPHVTIARSLTEDQYKTARKYFMNRKYASQFECNAITWRKLIKTNSYSTYEPIKTFPFAQKNLSLFN